MSFLRQQQHINKKGVESHKSSGSGPFQRRSAAVTDPDWRRRMLWVWELLLSVQTPQSDLWRLTASVSILASYYVNAWNTLDTESPQLSWWLHIFSDNGSHYKVEDSSTTRQREVLPPQPGVDVRTVISLQESGNVIFCSIISCRLCSPQAWNPAVALICYSSCFLTILHGTWKKRSGDNSHTTKVIISDGPAALSIPWIQISSSARGHQVFKKKVPLISKLK